MNGKPLAELRTEVELGLSVYAGYACVHKMSNTEYVYSACTDEVWPSFDELLANFGGSELRPIWSTFDGVEGHLPIEQVHERLRGYWREFGETQ